MQKTTRRRTVAAVQSPLETYLREINETALLTANEEKELSYGIEQGNKECPRPHGPRQPAAGGQHRPRLHRQGPAAAGPDRGGQPRPVAGGRGFRPDHEHPLQHLRQLLDQAVDQAGPHQHGQDDPHPGLHGRAAVEMAAGDGQAARRAGPHADASRKSPPSWACPRRSCRSSRRRSALQLHAADRSGRSRLVAGRDDHGRAS